MKVLRHLRIVVETLNEIGFAIAIEIDKFCDLIPTGDE